MKININEQIGKEAIKNFIEITKENKYKEIQKEIIREVFEE